MEGGSRALTVWIWLKFANPMILFLALQILKILKITLKILRDCLNEYTIYKFSEMKDFPIFEKKNNPKSR